MANLETVRRIYEGWAQGDFTVGLPEYADDIVLVLDPEFPESGSYRGPNGIRDGYMLPLLEAFDRFRIAADYLEESGGRVLAAVDQTGVGRDSGVPVEIRYFQLWTFRDGKVVRIQSIKSEADARDALAASA